MKKVKWGVLGTADIAMGCTIPGMVLAENCELYAIAGRSQEKADAFKEKFGFEKTYTDYQALLDDAEIQAVYIPLPNHLHYEWVMKAIEAGKNVLCEKPLAPSAEQAAELFAAAKKKGVVLMEAFAYLHSPYVAALKKEVEAKTIGDICYVEASFLTSGYELSNIRMQKACYGGAMYDLGCYCTSLILSILGREPVKVQGVAEYTEEGIDIFTTAIMQYGDGVRASLNCGMNLEIEKGCRFDRLYIHGTKGEIKSYTGFNVAGEIGYSVMIDGKEEYKTVNAPHNYSLEVTQLGRCVTDGEKPFVTEEFSIMNANMIDMTLEAIGYGR